MDWNAAIEKNSEALKRILAMLVAMAGIGVRGEFTFFPPEGAGASRLAPTEKSKLSPALALPRHLHRAVLRLLRPTEAAVRRLIIVAARGMVVALPPVRQRKPNGGPVIRHKTGPAGIPTPSENPHTPSLPLLDALPRWGRRATPVARGVPRISVPGFSVPFPVRPKSPDDPIDAARLALRFEALASALDDLPGQARRFARWRIRRDAAIAQDRQGRSGRAYRLSPLRPGRPPGSRRKPVHEVHEVLNVVQGLAFWALKSPDTS